jgi:hypothetical protein
MKLAVYHKRAKSEFYTKSDVPLSSLEIDRLLHTAYSGVGLELLTTGSHLRQEATGWVVGVDDKDSSRYHWFTAYKATQFGNKFITSGHDGERESVTEMKLAKHKLMNDPSGHFYGEASGAWERIYEKWGVPKVPFEEAKRVLAPKSITPVPDDAYAYVRALGGQDRIKVMFGYPKVSTPTVARLVEVWLR